MDYDDYPDQDDHFDGLEEEILTDESNKLEYCDSCGLLHHPDNLIEKRCENCWDDDVDWEENDFGY